MPRDGSNVYSKPAGTTAVANTTIESAKYNEVIDDLVVDANTPRAISVGGTGSSNAAAARTALGLEIGTDVQAQSARLADVAGLTPTDGNVIVGDGANFVAESGATARASLGLQIGVDVQAYDANTVTTTATQTLTNKTLTSPAITGGVSGDIYYDNGSNLVRLAKGTDGQVLSLASGVPAWADAAGGGKNFITKKTASNSASLDFTEFDATKYDYYTFVFYHIIPSSDSVELSGRTSTDGGSTWDQTANDYKIAHGTSPSNASDGTSMQSAGQSETATLFPIATNVGSAASEYGFSGKLTVYEPDATAYTYIEGSGVHTDQTGAFGRSSFAVSRITTSEVNAIQFFFDSGNIESGSISMYGHVNA